MSTLFYISAILLSLLAHQAARVGLSFPMEWPRQYAPGGAPSYASTSTWFPHIHVTYVQYEQSMPLQDILKLLCVIPSFSRSHSLSGYRHRLVQVYLYAYIQCINRRLGWNNTVGPKCYNRVFPSHPPLNNKIIQYIQQKYDVHSSSIRVRI